MNESMGGRAEINSMKIRYHEERPHTQGKSEHGEVLRGNTEIECRKGSDTITAEMLKYGGEIVVDKMMWICNQA